MDAAISVSYTHLDVYKRQEEGVRDALKEVLKRHPEWKPQKKEAAKNGFKVGVDTTGADGKDGAGKRALPTGTVIL